MTGTEQQGLLLKGDSPQLPPWRRVCLALDALEIPAQVSANLAQPLRARGRSGQLADHGLTVTPTLPGIRCLVGGTSSASEKTIRLLWFDHPA